MSFSNGNYLNIKSRNIQSIYRFTAILATFTEMYSYQGTPFLLTLSFKKNGYFKEPVQCFSVTELIFHDRLCGSLKLNARQRGKNKDNKYIREQYYLPKDLYSSPIVKQMTLLSLLQFQTAERIQRCLLSTSSLMIAQ